MKPEWEAGRLADNLVQAKQTKGIIIPKPKRFLHAACSRDPSLWRWLHTQFLFGSTSMLDVDTCMRHDRQVFGQELLRSKFLMINKIVHCLHST